MVLVDAGRTRAIATMRDRSGDAGTIALAVLRGELEKQRALPVILTRDPDVRSALKNVGRYALDVKLEAIARETRAAVIYVLGKDGVAIAASNWRERTSFVGNDYAFRDYFKRAISEGNAEQFALGSVSGRPGLYITSRILDEGKPLGVVVIKVEFDQVEADWRALGGHTFVVDRHGVVLISTATDWLFRTETTLSPEVAASVRQSLQSGAVALTPLPLHLDGAMVRSTEDSTGEYVASRSPIPTTDWKLVVLTPVGEAVRDEQIRLQMFLALILMPAAALGAFALRRRQVNLVHRDTEARVKLELETRVADRTLELANANDRLVEEMAERARAQERLSDLREELVQANRLATLGQVTAGVAHEINQPLAAMRTYAENARSFLVCDDVAGADGAMTRVLSLTDRIGTITDTLRGFARRGSGPKVPVNLSEAINGALMMLDAALRQAGVVPKLPNHYEHVVVLARLVELEQVLVNLMRNAIEALAEQPRGRTPQLTIDVVATGSQVDIAITDNGPGLDDAALARLFTPFRTTKARGLGLGLVISHDIIAGFGGSLSATSLPGTGSTFTISLERASP